MSEQKQQTIPVVDLSGFAEGGKAREQVIQNIGKGFQEIGFIAVENHGVDQELIKRAYQITEKFFKQPTEIKEAYEDATMFEPRGFSSMGREHVKGISTPDLKEFWHVGRETNEDGSIAAQFPKNLWPMELAESKTIMTELYDQLEMCACHILEASAMYLGRPQFFMCGMVENGNSVLRLAHYPPVPEGITPSVFRSAAHEDIDFITLLCEATGPGLEILNKKGEWLPVHAYEGQIIVNVGDMLQNLTNGLYLSTTHRVTNNNMDRNRRFSMPFFVHPRAEVNLSPLPECVSDKGRDPRYRDITAGQYFSERLTEIGFGKSAQKSNSQNSGKIQSETI